MNRSDEMKRVDVGPLRGEPIPGLGIVRFRARSDESATMSLDRTKEVMRAVISIPDDQWEDVGALAQRFPRWYVSAFRAETTPDEDERWLAQWRKVSAIEQRRLEEERGWSFSEWCYWMEPAQRKWQWWQSQIVNPKDVVVEVAVDEWPFANGSLRSMLRLSGFSTVDEEV